MWLQPVDGFAGITGGVGQDEPRAPQQLEFYDAGNFDFAYLPLIHCWFDLIVGKVGMKNILRGRIWRISDPQFLVMDEATSSVDTQAEYLLQNVCL